MASFKLMPNHGIAQMFEGIEKMMHSLHQYIHSLPINLHFWVENQRRPHIGAASARAHSAGRRNTSNPKGLYLCLWCWETITSKPNLAKHIRGHLNLRISFCDHCDFSSVDVKLPLRHKCRK
ncbi:hypothetical protein BJ165DRAFT_1451815 [Panaeolus papilionaceus]|nr:hypothetical protein BJ165DRAFT_1451815 [Panaeolus papilionaceus]